MSVFAKLRYIHARDVGDLCKILLTWLPGRLLRRRDPHIWLVSERPDDAHDNGYWFFRYLRTAHPEQHAYYVIRPDAPDAARVRALGPILAHGSWKHHVYFWAAEKNISAHVGNGFPANLMCRQLLMHGAYSFQNIFLQHGIIKETPPFLLREVNRIDLFITSAERERDAVIRDLGYRPEQVCCTGLCRYDGLAAPQVKPKQILIMPTWRWWLTPEYGQPPEQALEKVRASAYLHAWNDLLGSEQLAGFLEENDLTVLFFPHSEMQPFLAEFRVASPRIRVIDGKTYDVQQALIESALLVTDYSSIFFDFAYMDKPLIYYQFDREEYFTRHYPEGYFSFDNDGYGPVARTGDGVVEQMIAAYRADFAVDPLYRQRAEAFFRYRDTENCRRNYEAVRDFALPHFRKG